jgi:hypothetical protein
MRTRVREEPWVAGGGGGRASHRWDRRWVSVAVSVAIVVSAVALGWVSSRNVGSRRSTPPPTTAPSVLPSSTGPSQLALFAVLAKPDPFVALVGSMGGKPPAVVDMPARLVMNLPGAGSGTLADTLGAPASLISASVSNALGTWVGPQAVTDLAGLARIVDRAGGISVNLVQPVEVEGREIGPGAVTMDGPEASAFLAGGAGLAAVDRWQELLSALFRTGLSVEPDDLLQVADVASVQAVLLAARAPRLRELPATASEGGLLVTDDAAIRRQLASLFGIEIGPPVRVVVLNGSGVPGVGEIVASKLVPGGFRVVASGNARTFDRRVTQIVATTDQAQAQAEQVRRLLGVGTVVLGAGSSGLADITIVVGRDLTAG